MTYIGTVRNGVIVLPAEAHLPEGAQVTILSQEPASVAPVAAERADPFLAAINKLAKPRPHWPADYSLNHGHYVSGEPKKS